uniref:Uncharacterized protein n=1 Tax=Anguilla anguilla TaxID=7936 RepID=A0A0E9SXY6_ANGAN
MSNEKIISSMNSKKMCLITVISTSPTRSALNRSTHSWFENYTGLKSRSGNGCLFL